MANTYSRNYLYIVKIIIITFALVALLTGLVLPANKGNAIAEKVKWTRVNIPAEGEVGGWVLAEDSNVKHLTTAADGTLYVYANPSGTNYTLFRSANAGHSWTYCGGVSDSIIDIAVTYGDSNIIYYATESRVYKSVDAGNSFAEYSSSPGGAGTGNITITCLGVARNGGSNTIAVGTRDSDNSEYGGVYTLDESLVVPAWVDTGIGGYDVVEVTFSPNFSVDRQLLAVVTDEQDTAICSKIGGGGWGELIGDATIQGVVVTSSAIAFPDDYDVTTGECAFYVALDTGSGKGDVYKISTLWAPGNSIATDLDIDDNYDQENIDVAGLVVNGNTANVSLLAGAASSTRVYVSNDGGLNWTKTDKQPTGQSGTCLLLAPDYVSSGKAYAATSGTESAFSYTADRGKTWNQLSLIDTQISTNGIIDLAISPRYDRDNTLFLLTFDATHTEHSLWRSLNGGTDWERVVTSTLAGIDTITMIQISPEYGDESQVLYLAGTGNGNPAVWKSIDRGQTYTYRIIPISVDVWAAVDDNILLFGSYNGTNSLVYSTTSSGLFYSEGVAAGSLPLNSIALSPDYMRDGNILVGNTGGWVYYSSNNGSSFKSVPLDATSPPLADSMTVAFDPGFASNKTIYAASSSADKGIYRFTIDKSTGWERIDTTLPAGGTINKLILSADGTLYAASSQTVDITNKKGGIERSLEPRNSANSSFETITVGLDDGSALNGIWSQGSQLWAIDTANTRLVTYVDSLVLPLRPVTPADKAPGTGITNVILEWEKLDGATEYEWQIDYDTDFLTVPNDFEGNTRINSIRLPTLDADTGYFWRVRAVKPVMSRWSTVSSFSTGLGSTIVAPELLYPKAGAKEESLTPIFQWSAIAGANYYELVVSADYAFGNPTILKTGQYSLPSTAWQSNVNLDYSTTYYWRVRASGSGSEGVWSSVGAFTTASPPPEPASESESQLPQITETPLPSTPSPSSSLPTPASPTPQPISQDWPLLIIGALLLTILILLVVLLVVVVTNRRSNVN